MAIGTGFIGEKQSFLMKASGWNEIKVKFVEVCKTPKYRHVKNLKLDSVSA